MMEPDKAGLARMYGAVKEHLLGARVAAGHWEGLLSSSALSTATAVFALASVDRERYGPQIQKGLDWLRGHSNPDGGWGDTTGSASNISTTLLCWTAFTGARDLSPYEEALSRAGDWISNRVGSLEPCAIAKAVTEKYGGDRTFSAPILTQCALAGRLGKGKKAWQTISPLPFELASFPHWLFPRLRLSVVSYALPALIAIGQVKHHHQPPRNPLTWLIRGLVKKKTLSVLEKIQPESGGFLEAIPLTSFVVMSLAGAGKGEGPVARKGIAFLVDQIRDDGSWPIDTNLATWVTTLSVNALAGSSVFEKDLSPEERGKIQQWLLDQQYTEEHPYTHAAPGGWAWTDLSGGVPDGDDTAGALLALHNLGSIDTRTIEAAALGIEWLLGVQNSDGGIPTFCKGWAKLPFDRSATDLTAHAVLAMDTWFEKLPLSLQKRAGRAARRGIDFLESAQKKDGSWIPLWFGNEAARDQENPAYGTARVLKCLNKFSPRFIASVMPMAHRGVAWLLAGQNGNGGWGGEKGVAPSIEETALAVDALGGFLSRLPKEERKTGAVKAAIAKGLSWLMKETGEGRTLPPSPIGFYFAKLWYFEDLYPWIFTLSALNFRAEAIRCGGPGGGPGDPCTGPRAPEGFP